MFCKRGEKKNIGLRRGLVIYRDVARLLGMPME